MGRSIEGVAKGQSIVCPIKFHAFWSETKHEDFQNNEEFPESALGEICKQKSNQSDKDCYYLHLHHFA